MDFDDMGSPGDDAEPVDKYDNLNEEQVEDCWDTFDSFDKLKDQTIEISQLGAFLRWMNFNPTSKDLREYAEEFDPTHKGIISRRACTKIVDRRQKDPDTYEELLQALKIFDKSGTGKIDVPELRYILTQLGDKMPEETVDDVIYTLDPENQGFVTIADYGKTCFNIKDDKKNGEDGTGQGN